MKKIVIILVILILLGGAAAAAWWFFLRAPDEATAEVVEAPPPVLSEINLPPINICTIEEGRAVRRFLFLITLIFDDPAKQAWVEQRLPELNNDILVELHGWLGRKVVQQSGYDRQLLEQRLGRMTDQRWKPGTINRIYIRDMQILDSCPSGQ